MNAVNPDSEDEPERPKRAYSPRRPFVRNCVQCDTEYETTSYVAKYCSMACKERARYVRKRDELIEKAREYRSKNRDEINARRRNHRKNCSDCRDRDKRASREAYQRDRERRLAMASAYQKANPEVVALTRARRRAQSAFRITRRDHRRLLHRFRQECAYCGVRLTEWGRSKPTSLQWDHVVPLSRGGNDSVGNIVPSCRTCNYQKSAKLLVEWRRSQTVKVGSCVK